MWIIMTLVDWLTGHSVWYFTNKWRVGRETSYTIHWVMTPLLQRFKLAFEPSSAYLTACAVLVSDLFTSAWLVFKRATSVWNGQNAFWTYLCRMWGFSRFSMCARGFRIQCWVVFEAKMLQQFQGMFSLSFVESPTLLSQFQIEICNTNNI